MSELLMLDVRTMAFASGVSGILMAATMLGIYLAGMRSQALIDWMLAGLSFGVGYLVGHVMQTVDLGIPGWMAGTLANALIGLGHGFLLIGVQRYLGLDCWTRPILFVVGLILVSAFVFPELRESLRLRIIIHSGFYVLVDAYAGWLLWRAGGVGMKRFHRAAALVFLGFAGFLSLRFAYAVISPTLTTSFVQDPFQMGGFLAAMIFGFCITMALAVMMFREKQVEILGLAQKDPLTGLRNRLSLDRVGERQFAMARQQGRPLSMVLFDIDHFKQINDRHGHHAGDAALEVVAERIGEVIRETDSAFRFGGEEFLIMLPGAASEQAMAAAERLRQAICSRQVDVRGFELGLTASFGVAECNTRDGSWEDCLRRADQALYQAKRNGRNRVETHVALSLALPGY